MIKRTLIAIAIICMMIVPAVKATGLTVSFMTEQVTSVNEGNSLGVEIGYFFGVDSGLEPYIGMDWWPRWDEDGDMKPPSVVVLGVRNHFKDILDPNSAIPYLPDMFLTVINEDVEIKPYVGIRFSANIIDKNAGLMGIPVGLLVKTSPESNAALRFEVRYSDTFGDLSNVPDNQIDFYMGIWIPF